MRPWKKGEGRLPRHRHACVHATQRCRRAWKRACVRLCEMLRAWQAGGTYRAGRHSTPTLAPERYIASSRCNVRYQAPAPLALAPDLRTSLLKRITPPTRSPHRSSPGGERKQHRPVQHCPLAAACCVGHSRADIPSSMPSLTLRPHPAPASPTLLLPAGSRWHLLPFALQRPCC